MAYSGDPDTCTGLKSCKNSDVVDENPVRNGEFENEITNEITIEILQ